MKKLLIIIGIVLYYNTLTFGQLDAVCSEYNVAKKNILEWKKFKFVVAMEGEYTDSIKGKGKWCRLTDVNEFISFELYSDQFGIVYEQHITYGAPCECNEKVIRNLFITLISYTSDKMTYSIIDDRHFIHEREICPTKIRIAKVIERSLNILIITPQN